MVQHPDPLGSYELTTSYQYIYQRFDGGTGAYSANDYYIEAQAPNDTTIKFRLVWRDQAGGNIDESASHGYPSNNWYSNYRHNWYSNQE